MKNYRFILFVFIFTIVFGFNIVRAEDALKITEELRNFTDVINTTLYKGSKGEEVSKLQDFLIETDYLKVEKPTGYFGAQTEIAVKNFQEQIGLKPDGVVGVETRNFLKLDPFVSDKVDIVKEIIVENVKTNPVLPDCAGDDKFSALTGKPCDKEVTEIIPGCVSGFKFSPLTGKPCDGSTIETKEVSEDRDEDIVDDSNDDEEDVSVSDDARDINRIMFWYGKVNQHTDSNGNWQTDPDGVSGAGNYAQFGNEGYGDRKLEYCQKFYPDTKSFAPYLLETISTWKERGNVNNWTSTKLSYVCLE